MHGFCPVATFKTRSHVCLLFHKRRACCVGTWLMCTADAAAALNKYLSGLQCIVANSILSLKLSKSNPLLNLAKDCFCSKS